MNNLTIGVIAFWSASAVALLWSYIAQFMAIESKQTIDMLYFFHFAFFLIGLGFLIGRIIQWAKSRSD